MKRSLADALLDFADVEPADIAARLDVMGVRGERFQACSCPIAEYVMRETGAVRAVASQDGIEATYLLGDLHPYTETFFSSAPLTVRQFIKLFDDGRFPSLDIDHVTGDSL